jgi:hypothetical protein
LLRDNGYEYVDEFAHKVPFLRPRWGYVSFRDLLGVEETDDEEAEEDENKEECVSDFGDRW